MPSSMKDRHKARILKSTDLHQRLEKSQIIAAGHTPQFGIRGTISENVKSIATLYTLSARIAEAKKQGKPEVAEHLKKMRAATSERIRMFRKVIETLPSEDIRTFLTEAEKAGVSREEILEVAPPFLRKRILELK